MPEFHDGPASSLFTPLVIRGNVKFADLAESGLPEDMRRAVPYAPHGDCVGWGIPFNISDVTLLADTPVEVPITPFRAPWFIFMHTADMRPPELNEDGFISPMRGQGRLGERAATYVACYEDGSEVRLEIRRRHQIGSFIRRWGEHCFEAVAQHKPQPVPFTHEQMKRGWGEAQTRVDPHDHAPWNNWLWAWENPYPDRAVNAFRLEPGPGTVVLFAVTAGRISSMPLRWGTRQKACVTLAGGDILLKDMDEQMLLDQVKIDLGQVISALPRLIYPHAGWENTYNNQNPKISRNEILIEYAAHPEACFHLPGGMTIPVSQVMQDESSDGIRAVKAAQQPVRLRVIEKDSRQCVPVRLHIHGEWGEYLAPVDRHRIINPNWFEDYSVDFSHFTWEEGEYLHSCTYIPGETIVKLPRGRVYIEVSRGFEIRPVKRVFEVMPDTEEIVIEIEKVLPWREMGWVTADTHVHFLSPASALLEGSAEGVNVVNLLASQWGELMTNVGDFDGKTTWGSREAGGDGEHLVRVGSENRQHVLGHISLLGYRGNIIAPMTTGGPDESALGDPIEILLTEWARQCKKQGGLVVVPHFPNPRAEHAAAIVSGEVDAVEMTSWENHYNGIDPYSLSDWYRYLNCGYQVPAVGGTDKMSANTAVGTVRTYARLDAHTHFSYETWQEAVLKGETFVTYGPLLEFLVDGKPAGCRIGMSASGGTLDVTWKVASVTVPMTRVELVVNGEIRESVAVSPGEESGHWAFKVEKSSWLALLVRGKYPGKTEMIAAHSSPVMVEVQGSVQLAAADAVTILEQIEGALAYLDTVGTRAEEKAYKRMRLVLVSAHRALHNRMHQQGMYHGHTALTDHPEHH